MHLEAHVKLSYFLGYFTNQMLEGEFVYEELSALLELADLTESHYPWLVPLGPI